MSIVRMGLSEQKGFQEGYDLIFGKKKEEEKKTEEAKKPEEVKPVETSETKTEEQCHVQKRRG